MAGLICILVRFWSGSQSCPATEGIEGPFFWQNVPTALAVLAMLGVLWVALPAMLLPACTPSHF